MSGLDCSGLSFLSNRASMYTPLTCAMANVSPLGRCTRRSMVTGSGALLSFWVNRSRVCCVRRLLFLHLAGIWLAPECLGCLRVNYKHGREKIKGEKEKNRRSDGKKSREWAGLVDNIINKNHREHLALWAHNLHTSHTAGSFLTIGVNKPHIWRVNIRNQRWHAWVIPVIDAHEIANLWHGDICVVSSVAGALNRCAHMKRNTVHAIPWGSYFQNRPTHFNPPPHQRGLRKGPRDP